jgi:uncharacterized RDD family membrane protein YckC
MKQYQTTRKRFWAGVIDGLVLTVLANLRNYLLTDEAFVYNEIIIIVFNLLEISYGVLLHFFYGQTFGKMLMKIKVIDVSETRNITFNQSVFRDFFYLLSFVFFVFLSVYVTVTGEVSLFASSLFDGFGYVSFVWFILEIVTCLFNQKRRALHDFIAGTVVVRTDYLASLPIEKTA